MSKESQIAAKCEAFVQSAVATVGSHYLTGAAGGVPDMPNHVIPSRTVKMYPVLDPDPWGETFPKEPLAKYKRTDPVGKLRYLPILEAAWTGTYVCAGRHEAPEVKSRSKAFVTDAFILAYQWNSAYQSVLWPRPYGKLADQDLIWGESCWGKQHFDCIGLVNWCLSLLVGKEYKMSISQTVKEGNGVFKPVPKEETFKTYRKGDVLVRHGAKKSNNESASEHIAIVTKAGQIVEAADSTKGVRVTSLDPNRFNHHVRFSSYFWSVKFGIE